MKTTLALLILSITHAPAGERPATSTDIWLASQQQAADNARIMAQNERMIAAQEAAARSVESARVSASLAMPLPAPAPPPLAPMSSMKPPGYYAAMAERLTREKRAREAVISAGLAKIRLINADATLTEEQKIAKVGAILATLKP